MREINELIRNMGIRSEVINFDNAALSYMPAPVINAINKYNCRRNEAGPVSYTHLDVYKRQILYWFLYSVSTMPWRDLTRY